MLKRFSLPLLCATFMFSLLAVHVFAQAPRSRPDVKAKTDSDPRKDKALQYTTSWIGNTFGGSDPNPPTDTLLHVPLDMDSIYVTPDGKVYTNAVWEEGGRPVSVFKDGHLVSPLNDLDNSPNWSNGGGVAVAAEGGRIFVGYAPNGTGVGILNAHDMTNTGLTLSGSSSLNNSHGIFAMTVAKGKLYVTENDVNLVEVFDTATLSLVNSFSIPNPVRIAVDHAGGMWISHRDQTPLLATPQGNIYDINGQMGLATVDHYDASGTWINSITLPDGGEVGAICINDWGALLVGDDGPDQNIKVYANILKDPVLVSTIGEKGGTYAGPVPGRVGPERFRGITGLGTDNRGNLYVSQSGFGLDMGVGHGVTLQSYTWWGAMNWQVAGLEFVSLASVDPKSENDIYDAYHHFKVDYSKPPGHETTYVADTYDRFRYPDDVRVTSIASTGQIQYIHGRKFLLVGNQSGTLMEMYRFRGSHSDHDNAVDRDRESEIAIPCVAFDYGSFQGAYQDFYLQPLDGEFIWRDLNGDGQMSADEFVEPPNNLHRDGGFFQVDTNGDVWQINYQAENPPYEPSIHLRRYRFQGFDSFGAPIYDFNHMQIYNVPNDFPELTDVQAAEFFPSGSPGGTLYVAGNRPAQGSFSKIARYDNWDKGNRKATWVTDIPWDADTNNPWSPNSFTIAGDFLFVDSWIPHYNLVFHLTDGLYVGRFVPGPIVGGVSNVGNTDEWQANTSFRRANGEYVLIQEEDFQAKLLMYRWTPPNPLPVPPIPLAPTNFTGSPDDEAANLSWTGGTDALTYNVSRSTTSGGPYSVVDSGVYLSNISDSGLTNGQTYYYVVSTEADTGLSSTNSSQIAVTPKPAGTTYEAENAVLGGGAFVVTGCPLCSGGERVGYVVQGTSIAFNNVTVATAGTYALRVYVVNGNQPSDWGLPQEPTINLTVNGGSTITSQPLPYTGNWNTPGYAVVNVPLNAGVNTIELWVPADAATGDPDVDRIVVPLAPQ